MTSDCRLREYAAKRLRRKSDPAWRDAQNAARRRRRQSNPERLENGAEAAGSATARMKAPIGLSKGHWRRPDPTPRRIAYDLGLKRYIGLPHKCGRTERYVRDSTCCYCQNVRRNEQRGYPNARPCAQKAASALEPKACSAPKKTAPKLYRGKIAYEVGRGRRPRKPFLLPSEQ